MHRRASRACRHPSAPSRCRATARTCRRARRARLPADHPPPDPDQRRLPVTPARQDHHRPHRACVRNHVGMVDAVRDPEVREPDGDPVGRVPLERGRTRVPRAEVRAASRRPWSIRDGDDASRPPWPRSRRRQSTIPRSSAARRCTADPDESIDRKFSWPPDAAACGDRRTEEGGALPPPLVVVGLAHTRNDAERSREPRIVRKGIELRAALGRCALARRHVGLPHLEPSHAQLRARVEADRASRTPSSSRSRRRYRPGRSPSRADSPERFATSAIGVSSGSWSTVMTPAISSGNTTTALARSTSVSGRSPLPWRRKS